MYDLHDYARMIADEARMGPYVRALEAVVKPGSVVVDVGSGTGIFALVACRLGAKRVYAIETNDVIEVGRELARENGVADRIVFFHKDAREVELPERADVIVSDLRGALPLFGDHLAIIADARERFLNPGGVLVPERDRLMVAVVDSAELYEWAVGPARGPLGVTLESMRTRLHDLTKSESNPVPAQNLVSSPALWATLDYATLRPGPIAGRAELRVDRPSVGHGLVVWFEADLAREHGFSSADEELSSYGRLFLPWPRPVVLTTGGVVTVDLWAQPDGDPWGWNSSVPNGPQLRESFKQSSFASPPRERPLRARGGGGAALSQTSRS